MKTIHYNRTGLAISDYNISEWIDNMLKEKQESFTISTFLVIDEIRARIKEGKIRVDDITIITEGKYFTIDKNGRSNDWNNCSQITLQESILMRIL